MKIAILASNQRPIPSPQDLIFAPGVIIYEMTEELIRRGHDVTLFAPEGTKTKAKLITAGTKSSYEEFAPEGDFIIKRAENLPEYARQSAQYELLMASTAFEYIRNHDFDVVHSHKTLHEIYFTNFVQAPCLFTFHDPPAKEVKSMIDRLRLEKYAKSCYFVSPSNFQRKGIEFLNFIDTIYHGLDLKKFNFTDDGREELLFVGRLEKGKNPDLAIKAAQMAGKPLTLIGGEVVQKPEEKEYFKEISKNFDDGIKHLGHIHYSEMPQYYENKKALIFPSLGQESFGLVMIEAMACGTPVIAFNSNATPEVVQDGITGFLVPPDDINAMAKAIEKIFAMPEEKYKKMRQNCRNLVQEKFTIEKMVDGYEKVYQRVIEDWSKTRA